MAVMQPHTLVLQMYKGFSVVLDDNNHEAKSPDHMRRVERPVVAVARVGLLDLWVAWIGRVVWIGGVECPPRAPEAASDSWPFGIGQRGPQTRFWTWLRDPKTHRVITYLSSSEAEAAIRSMRLNTRLYEITRLPPEANQTPPAKLYVKPSNYSPEPNILIILANWLDENVIRCTQE